MSHGEGKKPCFINRVTFEFHQHKCEHENDIFFVIDQEEGELGKERFATQLAQTHDFHEAREVLTHVLRETHHRWMKERK